MVTSLFFNQILIQNSPQTDGTPNLQLQRSTGSVAPLFAFLILSNRIPPYVQNDSVGRKSNLEKTHKLNFSFGQPDLIGCSNLNQYTPNLQQLNI